MTDLKSLANPLFLREDDLRQGMELLFYAYRDFTAEPDAILARYGFGRAHHRVIYFVGRNPSITVSALLDILKVTKQSLSRVLGQLVRQGFVAQQPGARDHIVVENPAGKMRGVASGEVDSVALATPAAGIALVDDGAQQRVRLLAAQAKKHLALFGSRSKVLCEAVDFIVERRY